ncbi:hypothetical protein [Streptomyces fractus]|uniref:hypothetical protein n=1 Tax=Streptomyces fractus TaxID=641806 RepID=UPI003CECE225
MYVTFNSDLHAYVADMTGQDLAVLRDSDNDADRRLIAYLDTVADHLDTLILNGVPATAPAARHYLDTVEGTIVHVVNQWIAGTLGDKGFGPT